jgi:hypothetical protein
MSEEVKEKKQVSLADLGVKVEEPKEEKEEVIPTPKTTGAVQSSEDMKEIDIEKIAPMPKVMPPEKRNEQRLMELMDDGIERTKKDLMDNVITPLKDKLVTEQLEAEANGTEPALRVVSNDATPEPVKIVPPDAKVEAAEDKIINDNSDLDALGDMDKFDIEDDDLKDLLDETEEKDSTEPEESEEEKAKKEQEEKEEKARQTEIFRKHQKDILSKITPISNGLDLKEFRISTKPVSFATAMRKTSKEVHTATWALPNTKRLITFSALGGEEIVMLNPDNYKENRMLGFRTAYSIMYNHLIDANKPKDLGTWLKTICGYDIEHLYWCLYLATFKDSNYITYNCPICANLELALKSIEDMVVYPNDKVKEQFKKLLATGDDTSPSLLTPTLKQVSDDYVIGFNAPSIWSLVFETSALDQQFTEKYADILGVLAYIDNIYYINRESGTLLPIDYNADANNVTKSVKKKVAAYYRIIKSLNSDQYNLIGSEVSRIASVLDDSVTFRIPEHDCTGNTKDKKKCTHHFNAVPQTPLQLLFLRHQLLAIANSTIA